MRARAREMMHVISKSPAGDESFLWMVMRLVTTPQHTCKNAMKKKTKREGEKEGERERERERETQTNIK